MKKSLFFASLIFVFLITGCKKNNSETGTSIISKDTKTIDCKVTMIQGKAYLSGDNRKELNVGYSLQVNDTVLTDTGSTLEITLNGRSVIRMKENSILKISELTKNDTKNTTKLFLEKGKIYASPEKQKNGSTFEINTETITTGVRGTEYIIIADKDKVRVIVKEGNVAIKRNIDVDNLEKLKKINPELADKIEQSINAEITISPNEKITINSQSIKNIEVELVKDVDEIVKKLEESKNPNNTSIVINNFEKNEISAINKDLDKSSKKEAVKDSEWNNEFNDKEFKQTDPSDSQETTNSTVTTDTAVQSTLSKGIKATILETKVASNQSEKTSTTLENKIKQSNSYSDNGNLVLFNKGSFLMGTENPDDKGYKSELPVHKVELSDFYISKYELTFDEYLEFCKATDRDEPKAKWGKGKMPVMNVTWWDAVAYCNWKSEKDGFPIAYKFDEKESIKYREIALLDANGKETTDITKVKGWRLPTEAEWEYAARSAGVTTRYSNINDIATVELINFDANSENSSKDIFRVKAKSKNKTVIVGSYPPNTSGLYDMSGNVMEWCWDYYDASYYKNSQTVNPAGPKKGDSRVKRGGSYFSTYFDIRTTYRWDSDDPKKTDDETGFRIARSK